MKKNFIYGGILLIIICILLAICLKNVMNKAAHDYESPDTAITIRNGKADTIITKKQAPSWLK